MFMDISGNNLFDQHVGMVCAQVRPRCFLDITGIDLFDQNAEKVCGYVCLRYSLISLILIYLINMQIRNVVKFDTNVYGYH